MSANGVIAERISARQYKSGSILIYVRMYVCTYVRSVICAGAYEYRVGVACAGAGA